MGIFDQDLVPFMSSLLGVAGATGIMYSTRRADRKESRLAAEQQREITQKLADDLLAASRSANAFRTAGDLAEVLGRMLNATRAGDRDRMASEHMIAAIIPSRMFVLLGEESRSLADMLDEAIKLFLGRCMKWTGAGRPFRHMTPAIGEQLGQDFGGVVGPMLAWFMPTTERAKIEAELAAHIERLRTPPTSPARFLTVTKDRLHTLATRDRLDMT